MYRQTANGLLTVKKLFFFSVSAYNLRSICSLEDLVIIPTRKRKRAEVLFFFFPAEAKMPLLQIEREGDGQTYKSANVRSVTEEVEKGRLVLCHRLQSLPAI